MNTMSNRIQTHVPAVDTTTNGHLPYTVQTSGHERHSVPVTDGAREHTAHSDEHTRYAAAGLYAATCAYDAALTKPTPAATLDNMCDGLDEFMTEIMAALSKTFIVTGDHMEFAETLRTSTADRLWAFTAIERSRAQCGDGYGYVFDILADGVRNGHDPHIARTTALDVPKRLRENAEQAAATKSPNPVGIMLGTTQCCARRPDRDQFTGHRLDGQKDTDETSVDRLLCVEQHDHNGDHRDSLGRTWARTPAEVTA